MQKWFHEANVEHNSHLNGCKLKFSHILVPTLESFSNPLDSRFLEGQFSSRVYDFIIILQMYLCNSESLKIT